MNDQQKQRADYLHYSSVGIQMVLTILLFTYLGHRLDKYVENPKPIWTAVFALLGVVISMLVMLRSFFKPKPKKKSDKDKGNPSDSK